MGAFYPELAGYSTPDWVQEGTRLTYYVMSASIPEGRFVYFRDDAGRFVDQFGNRYRREYSEGTSGHGLMQVNVVSKGPRCVLDVSLYPYVGTADYVTSLAERLSVVDIPAAAGDFWLPPSFLASLPTGDQGPLRVVHLPYTAGGTTYRAIRFHYQEGRTVFVYDLDSGALIYFGTGGPSPLAKGFTHDLVAPAATSFLSHFELLDARVVQWPWSSGEMPLWLRDVQALHYSGAVTNLLPGSYSLPIQFDAVVRVLQRGSSWVECQTESRLIAPGVPTVPTTSVTVSGRAQAGGLWLPPAAASRLTTGQTLDVDPWTGVVTSTPYVGPSESGPSIVILRQEGYDSVFIDEYTYRLDDGMLVAWRHYQAPVFQLQELFIVGTH